MNFQTRIKIELHKLIHGKGTGKGKNKTVYDIAETLRKSYTYICRICSLTEDVPFPMEFLVPAMNLKQNFEVLRIIAWECGFALVPLPKRVKSSKKDDNAMVAEYQKNSSAAVTALINVIENLDPKTHEEFERAFKKVVENSLSVKKTIEKRASQQEEMELF